MAEGIYQELVDAVAKMRSDAGLVDAFVLIWGDYSVDQRLKWEKRGALNLSNDLILSIASSLLVILEKQVGNRHEAKHIFLGEIYKKMPKMRKLLEGAQDVE